MGTSIQAVQVESILDAEDAGQAGAIKFYTDGYGHLGMNFVCGKCLQLGAVSFAPGKWTFNGNREAPTVRNSILHDPKKCNWHVFLTDGRFEEC